MTNGTLKYKATGRYEMGWTDPRGIFGASRILGFIERFEELPTVVIDHFARDMTDDQLKAAWLLEYGDRPISFYELTNKWQRNESDDAMRIAQETHRRGLLLGQHDFSFSSTIYILKDKLHASS
jgi:hypothetical protein